MGGGCLGPAGGFAGRFARAPGSRDWRGGGGGGGWQPDARNLRGLGSALSGGRLPVASDLRTNGVLGARGSPQAMGS